MTDLAEIAGGDPLVVTLDGVEIPTDYVGPVVINHGRPTPDQRPPAPTCSASFLAEGLTTWPVIGSTLTVDLSPALIAALALPAGAARRFTGRVTDPAATPATGVLTVAAAGPLARALRVVAGADAAIAGYLPWWPYWPAETDAVRANRILAWAAFRDPSLVVGSIDPGTVAFATRAAGGQSVATLLDELAFSGGDVWQTRDGDLDWHDAQHRAAVDPVLTLESADVLAAATWTQSLDGLLTDLVVAYGPYGDDPFAPPVGGTQPEIRVTDAAAEDPVTGLGMGALSAKVSTLLALVGDAVAYAYDQVGRRSRPTWRIPALAVDVIRTLDDAQRAALLNAEPGMLIEVLGLPTTGPVSASRLWVEGWTEEIRRASWRMSLNVSAYGLTAPAPRWQDVPETWQPPPTPGNPLPAFEDLTWDSAALDGQSWLSAVAFWPGYADGDRWVDEPSNFTWADAATPTTEWQDL